MAEQTGPREVIASLRLRQYDSEFDASHLSWQDFTHDADEILAALRDAGKVIVDAEDARALLRAAIDSGHDVSTEFRSVRAALSTTEQEDR